jgi:uncharacterized protein (DUF2126 family)
MTIHVALNHRTRYDYDRRVELGPQTIRLRPAPHSRTPILSYALKIEPTGYFLNWQQDPHGNFMARVVYPEPVSHFHVEIDLVADMVVFNPFDFFLEPAAEHYPFEYEPELEDDLEPYLQTEPLTPLLKKWLDGVTLEKTQSVDFIVELNRRLQSDIGYLIRMEPGVQTPEQTLELASGSCRDSSWLLVQILRNLGIASRFVSGYLIQLVADVKALDGPSGTTEDFTDLHAWAEAYLPGAGWVGLDPTSGLLAGEGHIPLACTPKPSSAAPISGLVGDCETDFGHAMEVRRVLESPRVTKPYSDAQWQAIDAFGHRIDAELKRKDVRLTLGGEPTFVSRDNPDSAEWNTAATGPTKQKLAAALIERLRARFGPQGLLHFGQGKWYPGEQLPRWAYSLYWRHDGKPLWTEDKLIGHEGKSAIGPADAERFLQGVAARLGVRPAAIMAAYEDSWHFLDQERKLPHNVEAKTNRLNDPMARKRLARVFERGVDEPAGYVLPVQRWRAKPGQHAWVTEEWKTREGKLLLVPGDSPLGLRLPLQSLPHLDPLDYPHIVPADPMAERHELPDPDPARQPFRLGQKASPAQSAQLVAGQKAIDSGKHHVRAAMAAEVREGCMYVFMPPVVELEDYLDLVTAIEDVSAELNCPVRLEGYEPPRDARLDLIKVTPDPGVIEVNIQPADSWQDMVHITESVYEDAFQTRLLTEKFLLDGRHTGTGGGNHVVLGARTPADSPFLRRPDLLRSLIGYWQNHPALSYMFSGLFIGPTSQAPRVDEARHDSIYELDLAFKQIDDAKDTPAPWLVDRIFRHLLIDVTGNTHRAEICIDKLFSPDGPTGRLGLVEFRAFEMPPHPHMSLAQQLLLLSMIARFWDTPYKANLVRWGTRLHDRFMLPHFVGEDFAEVMKDMSAAGFELDPAWFAPHFEFRFPVFGTVKYGTIELELRQALEPWNVLGEESSGGSTSRYVDSSLERLQIKASGLNAERYVVACNGKRVPLTSTGRDDQFVGGVRYRAWQPASSLHPNIPVDTPLTIDLYDRWSGRAVAGCSYHVAHPGGRNFEHFPVNSYEAESRRLARFSSVGHTAGASPEPERIERPEFPCTLDLRFAH